MILASIWRDKLAVIAVLVLALGAGYGLRRTEPVYSESATVVFSLAGPVVDSAHYNYRDSLIATEVMIAQELVSQPGLDVIRAAGGGANFKLAPFNLYDLQYPNYALPVATLTVTAPNLTQVQRTFRHVRAPRDRLASLQAHVGVRPRKRLDAYLLHDKSVVSSVGSRARVFAGLALLTLMAVFMSTAFLTAGEQPGWLARCLTALVRRARSGPAGGGLSRIPAQCCRGDAVERGRHVRIQRRQRIAGDVAPEPKWPGDVMADQFRCADVISRCLLAATRGHRRVRADRATGDRAGS